MLTTPIARPADGVAHPAGPRGGPPAPITPALAAEFEAVFIGEMLKHSGLGEALGTMSGAGESGFSDLLVREIAGRIAETRSLGIAARLMPEAGGNG